VTRRPIRAIAARMPISRVSFAPSGLTRKEAKAACRRAYDRAKAAGGMTALAADRYYADTLTTIAKQPTETAAEMLRRTEHLLILLADRATWER